MDTQQSPAATSQGLSPHHGLHTVSHTEHICESAMATPLPVSWPFHGSCPKALSSITQPLYHSDTRLKQSEQSSITKCSKPPSNTSDLQAGNSYIPRRNAEGDHKNLQSKHHILYISTAFFWPFIVDLLQWNLKKFPYMVPWCTDSISWSNHHLFAGNSPLSLLCVKPFC